MPEGPVEGNSGPVISRRSTTQARARNAYTKRAESECIIMATSRKAWKAWTPEENADVLALGHRGDQYVAEHLGRTYGRICTAAQVKAQRNNQRRKLFPASDGSGVSRMQSIAGEQALVNRKAQLLELVESLEKELSKAWAEYIRVDEEHRTTFNPQRDTA